MKYDVKTVKNNEPEKAQPTGIQGLTDPDKVVYGPVRNKAKRALTEDSLEAIQNLLGLINEGLDMAGALRAKGRCPKCDGPFMLVGRNGYICPKHKTVPKHFYIDLSWNGSRQRFFSDKQGQPLDTFQRAYNLLSTMEAEIENLTFDPADYMKVELVKFYFSTRIQDWIEGKERENLAPSTLKTYKTYIRNFFKKYFEDKDIRNIRSYDIRQFYLSLNSKYSPKYQKGIMDCLENFFNDMVEFEFIKRKPQGFPTISVLKAPPKWRRETQDKILSFIPEPDRPIFIFLTRQGIRPGEARSLKVKDFDFERGIITVARTFSDRIIRECPKPRLVKPRMINPELIPMLKMLCADKLPEAYVFLNPRTGRPYTIKPVNNMWNEACKEAKVQLQLKNGTRHSVASQAATAGVPIQAIQGVLGHTDIRTTMENYACTDLSAQMVVFAALGSKDAEAKVVDIASRK
ncbi:MAG: site-specific integrase [Nitrospirae bacterium]|nr:site-specific integrase [Nitrospirota bacterium]